MGKNNSLIKIIQSENNFGVYRNMEKQKFDRMKTILGILMLVFAVVPLTAITVTAASDSGCVMVVMVAGGDLVGEVRSDITHLLLMAWAGIAMSFADLMDAH